MSGSCLNFLLYLGVVIYASTLIAHVEGKCKDRSWVEDATKTSCYKVVCERGNSEADTGDALNQRCATFDANATAASIVTAEENAAVQKAVEQASCKENMANYWIGLSEASATACDSSATKQACTNWKWFDGRTYTTLQGVFTDGNAADTSECGVWEKDTNKWNTQACTQSSENDRVAVVCRMNATPGNDTMCPPHHKRKRRGRDDDDDDDFECLYGGDEVMTERDGLKMVKDLAPGDRVLSVSSDGEVVYDELYMIAHASPQRRTAFTRITVRNNNADLYLTKKHLIYSDGVLKTAEQVRTNDTVYLYDPNTGTLTADVVHSVGFEVKLGTYNPVTAGGRLLVNSVLTSAYPRVYRGMDACGMHSALWPARMLYQAFPAIVNAGYHTDGMPLWVKLVTNVLSVL